MIFGFVAAVLGGMGSTIGALVGGIAVGVMQQMVGGYISSAAQHGIAFALLVVMLVVRPQGLFGQRDIVQGMIALRDAADPLLTQPVFILAVIAALFFGAAWAEQSAPSQILSFLMLNIMLAQSMNLLTGIAGQISLGHAGFYRHGRLCVGNPDEDRWAAVRADGAARRSGRRADRLAAVLSRPGGCASSISR